MGGVHAGVGKHLVEVDRPIAQCRRGGVDVADLGYRVDRARAGGEDDQMAAARHHFGDGLGVGIEHANAIGAILGKP